MNKPMYQQPNEFKDYYLNEFIHFDGENFITFNLVYLDLERNTVTVAITDTGKIVLSEYELLEDCNNNLYFEYGSQYTKIYLKDFEEVRYETYIEQY